MPFKSVEIDEFNNINDKNETSKENGNEFSLKSYLLLLILFIIIINSDIFQNMVLGNIKGTLDSDKLSLKEAVLISGLMLIILHAILCNNI